MESNRQIPALQKVTLPADHHFREGFPYQNSHTGVFRGMRVSTFLKETKTEPRKVNTAANLKVIKGVVVPGSGGGWSQNCLSAYFLSLGDQV